MEFAEKLVTSNVACFGVAAAAILAGIIFLVFKINPGPNYAEVFRKQREQLMAMNEPKQKKKEKTSKKKEKRADKKEQLPSAVSQSDEVTKHDHVDFSERQQVKVVELDEPLKVEVGKVLAPNRQPVKPILIHSEDDGKSSSQTEVTVEASRISRSNSFREIKPKDEVELHHKKQQQSPSDSAQPSAPTAKVAPITVSHQPHCLSQQIDETKEVSQKKQVTKAELSTASVPSKKSSPIHEKKERRIFSKKELRELINQIEQRELPADIGEETVQRLVDALLNHQNESKEWKSIRQDPMQTVRKKLLEKEETIIQLTSRLDSALARSKELHAESSSWKMKCSQMQTSIAQIENRHKDEISRAQRQQQQFELQKQNLEAFNETLRGRVQQLEFQCKDLEGILRSAEERLVAEKQSVDQTVADQLDELRKKNESLERQIDQATSIKDQLESEKRRIEARLKQTEAEISATNKLVAEAQAQIASLEKDLSDARSSSTDSNRLREDNGCLKEEIAQLKARNEQLQKKNWSTVEGINQAEKKLSDLQRQVVTVEGNVRKTLLLALPKTAADDLKDLEGDEFVKNFVQHLKLQSKEADKLKAEVSSLQKSLSEARKATASSAAAAAPAAVVVQGTGGLAASPETDDKANEELGQLREEVTKLRISSAHYSAVLNDTEKLLKGLQDNVELEEQKWNEDRKRFEVEKSEMSAAFRDLESKLIELQTQLQDSEQEKSSTINQLDDTRATVDKLNQQLAEVQQAVTPIQPQQNGHQSEESSATSPTRNAQQNGGGHDGDDGNRDGGDRAGNKEHKKKKKAKKVS